MSASQARIFKGSAYAAPFATPAALAPFGNIAKITLAADVEVKELPDYENPGGGLAESYTRFKSGKITLDLKRVSAKNLAMALGGKATAISAGAVVGEAVVATLDCLCPIAKPQDMAIAMQVKDSGGTTTYVEGTDYIRKRAGIIPLASGTITAAQALKISYTALAGNTIEGLVDLTAEYRILLDGVDEVSGEVSRPDFYRVKFGPAKSIDWLGDDFVTLSLEGTLLKDESKTGTGASQYTSVLVGY